ncbi:MAG: HAMP domain-containing histidine kinase [Magnetococcales bacterium]|nr:HAMP domain-containing histidine kinase [Magnetococcales bacterium]
MQEFYDFKKAVLTQLYKTSTSYSDTISALLPMLQNLYSSGCGKKFSDFSLSLPTCEFESLSWLSEAITTISLCHFLPLKYLTQICNVMDYYGLFFLSIEIAEKHVDQFSIGTEERFQLLKIIAKSYKNDSKFEEARKWYRQAIQEAHDCGNKFYIDYFLLLFAKLCNDFQQRQGWYITYHKIAYQRFAKNAKFEKKPDPFNTWRSICVDSYSKALYNYFPKIAERNFRQLLNDPDLPASRESRIKSHLYSCRIIKQIMTDRSLNEAVIYKNLSNFKKVVDSLRPEWNRLAYSVRLVQYFELVRNVADKLYNKNKGTIYNDFQGWLFPYCHSDLLEAYQSSELLSDWKTSSRISYEIAKYYQILIKLSCVNDQALLVSYYKKIRESLVVCINILDKKSEKLPDLYVSALLDLADLEHKSNDYTSSANYCLKAYDFVKKLSLGVQNDESSLEKAMSRFETEVPSEFSVLTLSEKKALLESLRQDYRVLLQRMLLIAEKLHDIQKDRIAKDFNNFASSLYNHLGLHTLSNIVTSVDILSNRLDGRIKELQQQVKDMRSQGDNLFPVKAINVYDVVDKYLNTLKQRMSYDLFVNINNIIDKNCMINFNEELFVTLIKNIIYNAEKIIDAAKIDESKVNISFSNRVTSGVFSLEYCDNLGNFDEFFNVIDRINNNIEIIDNPSNGISGSGVGLLYSKRAIMLVSKIAPAELLGWSLIGNDASKTLTIPLSRLSEL